mgnify:FL=1
MTPRELSIDVPSVPFELLPNRRKHWAAHARAVRDYGAVVRLCAISARNGWVEWQMAEQGTIDVDWMPLSCCTVQVVATIPRSRRGPLPDPDNLAAACKSLSDALTARDRGHGQVGAGIIEDDGPEHVTLLPIRIERGDAENVRIIVTEVV